MRMALTPASSRSSDPTTGIVVASARHKRTAGTISVSSASWTDLDTSTDLTLTGVEAGDVVTVQASGLWGNAAASAFMDCATIVAAAVVNSFGSGEITTTTGSGIESWAKENAEASYRPIAGGASYVLQAGDISGGSVTLRLRVRRGGGAVDFWATAANPFQWNAVAVRV